MDEVYFFDSYALVEIRRGNPHYAAYTKAGMIITKLNLFEVYHGLLRDIGKEDADIFLGQYYPYAIDIYAGDIQHAAQLRVRYKKRNLSMADCIGYAVAKRLGIRFLTGDQEFKDFENVEYVR